MISSGKKAGKAVRVIMHLVKWGQVYEKETSENSFTSLKAGSEFTYDQNLGTFTVDEILDASGTKSLPLHARY